MRLGDSSVQIIDGDRGKNYPNKFSNHGYCLFLSAKNVTTDGFVFNEGQFISQERDNLLRKGKLVRNDIVLTTRGTVGNIAYYDSNAPFDNVRINSGMVILRSNPNNIHPKFLYYIMRSPDLQNQITQLRTGSAQPQLPISHLVNLDILLPPLSDQIIISQILSAIDDKIATNRKINHHLAEIAQAIFKSWFLDFEPWGGEMPSSWRVGTLSDICSYNNERIPVSSLTVETYISTENMTTDKGGFVRAASLPTISQTTAFTIGDTLISNIRPYFKKIVYGGFTGGCSTDVLCFRPHKIDLSLYVHNALLNDCFFDYMVAGSKGTKMPRGDKQQIMNYEVLIPSDSVLTDFTNLVAPLFQKRLLLTEESDYLTKLRDVLLPRLMSGELSVADF